jgi:hypothetical protein
MRPYLSIALKDLRNGAGLKPRELEEATGRDRSMLTEYERPDGRSLKKLEDLDRVVEGYAREIGVHPREIWRHALELWERADATGVEATRQRVRQRAPRPKS